MISEQKRRWPKIFRPIQILLDFLLDELYPYLLKHIRESLRLQLILVIGISFLAALMVASLSESVIQKFDRQVYIDYRMGKEQIDNEARSIAQQLQNPEFSLTNPAVPTPPATPANPSTPSTPTNPSNSSTSSDVPLTPQDISQLLLESKVNPLQKLVRYINQEAQSNNVKILIVSYEGEVLLKSEKATEVQVDIHTIIENTMNSRINPENDPGKEFFSFYPLNANRLKGYVLVSGIPQAHISYAQSSNSSPAMMLGLVTFIFTFLLLTRRKMRYLEHLAQGVLEISKGNLEYRVAQKTDDELGLLARNINHMTEELQQKIEQERETERMKNELITNVSHDLRTPLTSIMGYLRLLLDQKYESPEQAQNYLNVAFGKSEKLKGLIEDLFEYTKLTNENNTLNPEKVSLIELLEQLLDEMVPISEEQEICFKAEFPAEKVWVTIDVDKMIRVYENLIINAIKYSKKPGEVRVQLWEESEYVLTGVYNSGEGIPAEDLAYLFERFFRVEKSRTSSQGGSGLGLAIAKQIVDLHGGEIWAESEGEDVRFFVKLRKSIISK